MCDKHGSDTVNDCMEFIDDLDNYFDYEAFARELFN